MKVTYLPCDVKQSCYDAACHPWSCVPDQPMCVATVATKCDPLGKGPLPNGEDCAATGKTCVVGECICIPSNCQSLGKNCGIWDTGCGGKVDCGVCQGGLTCVQGVCTCIPNCAGKQCGDDGCGGSCGPCSGGNNQCVKGQCLCVPSTCEGMGWACGTHSNGCGGQLSCGTCTDGRECIDGKCVCVSNCIGKQCGPDGCGGACGSCPWTNYICSAQGLCICLPQTCQDVGAECGVISNLCGGTISCGTCPAGQTCNAGKCGCVPNCAGRQCGSDGCGGVCGSCAANQGCVNFQCVALTTLPGCKTSTSTGCGGCYCESCVCQMDPYCCTTAWDSICVGECTNQCGGCLPSSCGNGICESGNKENCSTCNSDCICPAGQKCYNGSCCTPSCAGKQCGDDGCGGSCGTCSGTNMQCVNNQCVCVPSTCGTYQCGIVPNGCGGSMDCAGCPANHVCQGNTCVCVPNCTGKQCGDNGCGGSCGTCTGTNMQCVNNQCVCVPSSCTTYQCGIVPNGCGGTMDCDGCPSNYACQGTTCVCTPNCTGKQCGNDGCGGSCGTCNPNQWCIMNYCWP